MSKLREQCEKAANEAIIASHIGMLPSVHDQLQAAIADAIEKVATDHAKDLRAYDLAGHGGIGMRLGELVRLAGQLVEAVNKADFRSIDLLASSYVPGAIRMAREALAAAEKG